MRISNLEIRDDSDKDVQRYTFDKDFHEILVDKDRRTNEIESALNDLADEELVPTLIELELVPENCKAKFLNRMGLLDIQNKFKDSPKSNSFNSN